MQLQIRKKDNRIIGYCTSGSMIDDDNCIVKEVDDKTDLINIFYSFYKNGQIVFDNNLKLQEEKEKQIEVLRQRREVECFSVINRGDMWYSVYVNTSERKAELDVWYKDWLNVTETLVVPKKPQWIN